MSRTTSSPGRARLATALRELKERTGLSLAGLAERTPYSKSSWDRYLGGKALPPRQAVRDLCRLAREPDGRCLALWEIAESEWKRRAAEGTRADTGAGTGTGTPKQPPSPAPAPAATPAAAPAPSPAAAAAAAAHGATRARHRGAAVLAVLASVCAVIVAGTTVVLSLLPGRDGGQPSSRPPAASSEQSTEPPTSASASWPHCRGDACEGEHAMRMACASEPETLSSHRTATGARMELRYSEKCGTSWARMWDTGIGDRLAMTADGRTHGAEVADELDAKAYVSTPMTAVRPGTVVRACLRPAAGGEEECFTGRTATGGSPDGRDAAAQPAGDVTG